VQPLIQGPLVDRNAEVSPDGQWLAYESNDSGQPQVFVRPFPDVNKGKIPVSTVGGAQPLCARNGQELFYIAPGGALMSVPVKRVSANQPAPRIVVVQHWLEELKRLVPTK
jgi:hypothetical protein